MKIEDILSGWDDDAKTAQDEISTAALSIPVLHAKYLRIFVEEKMRLKKEEQRNIRLRANKRMWMLGELSKHELATLGWDQWLRATPLRSQVDEMLESDEDCMMQSATLALQKQKVEAVDQIIKIINNRSFQLNVALGFIKFQSGVG